MRTILFSDKDRCILNSRIIVFLFYNTYLLTKFSLHLLLNLILKSMEIKGADIFVVFALRRILFLKDR